MGLSNDSTEKLVSNLVEKSEEAFIVGVEIYNKPTLKYRVEGFSFFICNAWELLLKAYMVQKKGEDSIYYPDHPERTRSLKDCIKRVFTNNKDPLRKNLETIIDLRNTSTHFITEEYEQIYVPLFQSCVLNYINKLLQFFNRDITEKLGSNFLTLSVKIDEILEDEINARYPYRIAKRILQAFSTLGNTIDAENNPAYAIPVRHDFYITKNPKLATAEISITKDANQAAFIMKKVQDMQNECPYQMNQCLTIINDWIKRDKLNFINPYTPDDSKRHTFNSFAFRLFLDFYNMKADTRYCYTYSRNANPYYSYSEAAIHLIYDTIKKDPEHIVQNLKENIKRNQPQGQRNSQP